MWETEIWIRVTEGKGIQKFVTVKKHQIWQKDLVEKALGVGVDLVFIVELNV